LSLAAMACGGDSRPPNLVLISIDTLRADHVGVYGYGRPTTPNLDRLAAEGLLFERAYSTANWTLPAHVSLLSGLSPAAHGVERYRHRISAGVELLPERLALLGYRSAAVVSTVPFLKRKHGFARGWEVYDDETAYPPKRKKGTTTGIADFVSSPQVTGRAIELLEELGEGPFFLFLHYFDVHDRYVPPPPFDTAFDGDFPAIRLDLPATSESLRAEAEARVRRYDGELRSVDHWIGRFLDQLERRGLSDRTAVVVTADHGEEFQEHGAWTHHKNLYETALRVPLLMRLPGGRRRGEKIATPVSLVDVPATLLGLADGRTRRWREGRDLRRTSGVEPRFSRSECGYGSGRFRAAVFAGGLKLIVAIDRDGRPRAGARAELYRPELDSSERRDLARTDPGEVGRLLDILVRHQAEALAFRSRSRPDSVGRHSAEELGDLRALGYL
jgi:arylsulfatase A-like enzyme